jgi:NADPH-dependent curcumin reductase CurA
MQRNKQVILARLPRGPLSADDFEIRDAEVPTPQPGQLLCRTILLSLDPANRAWMNGATYRDQQQADEVMSGFTLCEVIDPNGTDIARGAVVACEAGWQEYAAVPANTVQVVRRGDEPLEHHMGVLGITGLTAYFGLFDIGKPIPGDTVVVSAASGATGSVAGQLARLAGARVVGITGSDEKNAVLINQLGFDAALNRRSDSFGADLKAACPDGIDVYFDNVGGEILDNVLLRMNLGGRVICCGAVSTYDDPTASVGSRVGFGLAVVKRLTVAGFIVLDHLDRWPAAQRRLAQLVAAGKITALMETIDGLENAPQALIGLLAGDNVGKRIIRVGAAG